MKNKIVYNGRTFEATDIKSGQIHFASSLPSMKLEPNTFTAVVKSEDKSLTEFTRNTPLYYYYRERLVCISYVQTVDRIGPNKYKFYGTSAIGRLIEQPHAGGIYTGQTAEEVITDICGPVPFEIKNVLKKIKLYGWLPYANPPKRSARDNLVQVLFAIGAAIRTDLDGVLRIEGLWDGISGGVGRDKMYTGATTEYDGIITSVIVTEHQYVPWTEEKQLFEGTAQAGDIITFDEPMHDLVAEGFSLLDSGANWAKVSAGPGTLTGKTYIHNTRQVSKAVQEANTPNVKTVEDATLVSLTNSTAVAQRLADYYKCRERIDASVIYQGESPGDRLAAYHPFDKTGVAACMESADITLSNTLKAQEKLLVGYVPPQTGEIEYYDKLEIFTTDGEFLVPEGTTTVRAYLVGGGDGGSSGEYGGHAKTPKKKYMGNYLSVIYTGVFGRGGKGGLPGKGGKVLSVDADVIPGSIISYKIGKGGKGGIKNSSGSIPGALGGDTIFGAYSSKDGVSTPEGTTIPIADLECSGDGRVGISGGPGAGAKESEAEVFKPTISIGSSVTDYSGRIWSAGYPNTELASQSKSFGWREGVPVEGEMVSIKGHGGGAAVGNNGRDGSYGQIVKLGTLNGYGYTGTTGKGADATQPAKAQGYGKGGDGGHGGGGEGGSGRLNWVGGVEDNIKLYIGTMSGPGKGSDGADGADGCLVLFYRSAKPQNSGQLVDKNGKMVLDRLGRRIIM